MEATLVENCSFEILQPNSQSLVLAGYNNSSEKQVFVFGGLDDF